MKQPTIKANTVASCVGLETFCGEPPEVSADDKALVTFSAIHCMMMITMISFGEEVRNCAEAVEELSNKQRTSPLI